MLLIANPATKNGESGSLRRDHLENPPAVAITLGPFTIGPGLRMLGERVCDVGLGRRIAGDNNQRLPLLTSSSVASRALTPIRSVQRRVGDVPLNSEQPAASQ